MHVDLHRIIYFYRSFLNFPLSSLPFTSLRPYFSCPFVLHLPSPIVLSFLFHPSLASPFALLLFSHLSSASFFWKTPALTRNWTLRTYKRTPALIQNRTLRFRVGFLVLKNGKELRFIRSGWLPSSEEWKRTKIRSGWLPSSEEWKEPSFVRPFGFDSFASSEERKKTKIRLGGLPIFGKSGTKIRSGGFLNSEEWKIKIRSGGFSNSEVQKRTKIRKFQVDFRRSEKKEPRFVSSGGLPSYGERKKIKIRRLGWISDEWINQNQDS
ncbi:hypothetical protein RIR_jg17074.t2 [Rhizophagus irregularis DAOM 181602=DAOM 197198]|nr:hypothetical protein RIR_jg17074.t2 [Rhizophagus irregularis DAOM 181602=DAOM 197198]